MLTRTLYLLLATTALASTAAGAADPHQLARQLIVPPTTYTATGTPGSESGGVSDAHAQARGLILGTVSGGGSVARHAGSLAPAAWVDPHEQARATILCRKV